MIIRYTLKKKDTNGLQHEQQLQSEDEVMQSVQAQAHECERAYRNSRPALSAGEDGVCGSVWASVLSGVQSDQESLSCVSSQRNGQRQQGALGQPQGAMQRIAASRQRNGII